MYSLSVAYSMDDYKSESHLSDGIDFIVESKEEAIKILSFFINKGFDVYLSKIQ